MSAGTYRPGVGPTHPGTVMVVGDLPTVHNGETGAELRRYLRRSAKLQINDLYVTSIIKFEPSELDYKPAQVELDAGLFELQAEIDVIQPSVIVVLGQTAGQLFVGDKFDMDKMSGLPAYSERFKQNLFICHHPAIGITQPDRFAVRVEDDFIRLGKYLNGWLPVPVDQYQSPVYTMAPHYHSTELTGVDTEGSISRPWCVSATVQAGAGAVIKPSGQTQLDGPTVMHYGLHDIPVLAQMGISVDLSKLEDTNIIAYLLGNEPKRLKALAYRYAGMEMEEYEDIIKEADEKVTREYLQKVIDNTCNSCGGAGELSVPYKRPPKCLRCAKPKPSRAKRKRSGGNGDARVESPAGDRPDLADGGVDGAEKVVTGESTRREEGASSVTQEEATCQDCGGTGYQAKFKKEKCPDCAGDGTAWPNAGIQIVLEDDGSEREYRPQSIGRRVRRWLASGVDSPRDKWQEIPAATRNVVEARLGRFPAVTLDDVADQQRVINYAGRDADATLRVYHALRPKLAGLGLERAYEIDKSIIPAIDDMQRNGIQLDAEYFRQLGIEFEQSKLEVQDKLAELVGKRFNPASSKQVAEVLFQDLSLTPTKLTDKGEPSTDEKALQMLKIKYFDHDTLGPIIGGILDYRELNKMLGTYVYPLPRMCDRHGRLHTSFSLTRTSTGRLASSNPNLQNIPARSKLGLRIRSGFVAAPGRVLVSVDLDQIELRVCAHLANDASMIEVFRSGLDIHRSTAAKMFSIPFEQVATQQRVAAKTINFGVLYGMSANRLMNELAISGIRISKQQARSFIDAWFKAYPGVKAYMDRCHQEARRDGYVRTLHGHIRRLPNVHSALESAREEALRQAGNAPTQGTAAEILKIALANVHAQMPTIRKFGYAELLLNIHDEIILEVDEGIAEAVVELVAWEMANAVKLNVPLGAKGVYAKSWGELKG